MLHLLFVSAVIGLVCGLPQREMAVIPKLDGRIVGGVPTKIDFFAYQISLLKRGFHDCGGSLLDPVTVLTAAHCTFRHNAFDLAIRAGSTYHDRGGQIVQVRKIYQHPLFNRSTVDYDISVLKLKTAVKFGATARGISLSPKNSILKPGSEAVVSGWGASGTDVETSALQFVRVPIVSPKDCADAYRLDEEITDRQICAGYLGVGGKDSCQGDSGGPLVRNDVLIGVVSWGTGCAQPEYPGVYANVANLRSFIDQHLSNDD